MGCSSSRPSSSSPTVMSPAAPVTASPRAEGDLGDHDMYEVYSQDRGTSTQQKKRRESKGDKASHAMSSPPPIPSSSSSSATSVPYWVIKTRNSEHHKVFINVCGNSGIGKTSNFSKPVMRVLPPLEDMDKKNDNAFTYDALLSLEDCEFLSQTHGEFGDLDGFWTEINKAIVKGINEICGDELSYENLSFPILMNKYKGSQVRSLYEAKSSNSKQRRNSLSKARQLEVAESIDDSDINLQSSSLLPPPPLPPPSSSSPSSSSLSSSSSSNVPCTDRKKLPTASPIPRRATATTLSLLTPARKSNSNITTGGVHVNNLHGKQLSPIRPPPGSTDSKGIERTSYATYTKTMLELKGKLEEQGRRRSSSSSSSSGRSFNSGDLESDCEADDSMNEVDRDNDHKYDGAIVTDVGSMAKTKYFDNDEEQLRTIPRGVSVAL